MASVPPKGGRKHPQQDFLQVDTTNILFICGGAFHGLEQIVQHRTGVAGIGFGADIKGKREEKIGEILMQMQPEDLLKYGLIPEFVGRLPVIATLDDLSEDALVEILVKPKNALIKQYTKLFEFENVTLTFTQEGIRAIAREATRRKSGARGLRAILEDVMLDIMYEIPSRNDVRECIVNEEVLTQKEPPLLLFEKRTRTA